MSFPRDMIPQSYPLGCRTLPNGYYFVIGWTTDGLPVVVKSGSSGSAEIGPRVLTADQVVEYYVASPS